MKKTSKRFEVDVGHDDKGRKERTKMEKWVRGKGTGQSIWDSQVTVS